MFQLDALTSPFRVAKVENLWDQVVVVIAEKAYVNRMVEIETKNPMKWKVDPVMNLNILSERLQVSLSLL